MLMDTTTGNLEGRRRQGMIKPSQGPESSMDLVFRSQGVVTAEALERFHH